MRLWPIRRKVVLPQAEQPPAMSAERVLSILNPDQVESLGGLPVDAIVGSVAGEELSSQTFRPNAAFIDFLHKIIEEDGPDDPGLRAAAREQVDGWVYVIDMRTPDGPQGRVPPDDIIGGFAVRTGEVVRRSYQPNPKYVAFTSQGLISLPPFLHQAFVDRLPRVRS
jgi:hypothetical protein